MLLYFSAIKDNEDLEVADYLPSDINDMEKICTEDYSVKFGRYGG